MKRFLQNLKLNTLLHVALICITVVFAVPTAAQEPSSLHDQHFRDSGFHPPGQIGQGLLSRGGPIPGYFQPIEFRAPQGTQIAFVANGRFGPSLLAPTKAGMLIGAVYRLKITNIPELEGIEVFPSIEVINRIYPPPWLRSQVCHSHSLLNARNQNGGTGTLRDTSDIPGRPDKPSPCRRTHGSPTHIGYSLYRRPTARR